MKPDGSVPVKEAVGGTRRDLDERSKMRVEEVIKRVQEIEAVADRGDPEAAHSREDSLYFDVLVAIASGSRNMRRLAQEAVKAAEIEFVRWCA